MADRLLSPGGSVIRRIHAQLPKVPFGGLTVKTKRQAVDIGLAHPLKAQPDRSAETPSHGARQEPPGGILDHRHSSFIVDTHTGLGVLFYCIKG